MPSTTFLSSAEAAYIAGLSEPVIHSAVANHVVSEPLIRQGSEWHISRLAETVVGSLADGLPLAELNESYALLTEDLVESAQIYTQTHPTQERARRMSETHPDWKVTSITQVHLSENEWRLFLDECLSPSLVGMAIDAGFEATCARDRGLLGAKRSEPI